MSLLTLDHDEAELALAALLRVSGELDRQIPGGHAEGCSGAARYVAKYAAPKICALIERIEQWKQDEKAESANA